MIVTQGKLPAKKDYPIEPVTIEITDARDVIALRWALNFAISHRAIFLSYIDNPGLVENERRTVLWERLADLRDVLIDGVNVFRPGSREGYSPAELWDE